MTDAFIYDHVRTPRGRGKADGALHEVTALNLATQPLAAMKERNKLDPKLVRVSSEEIQADLQATTAKIHHRQSTGGRHLVFGQGDVRAVPARLGEAETAAPRDVPGRAATTAGVAAAARIATIPAAARVAAIAARLATQLNRLGELDIVRLDVDFGMDQRRAVFVFGIDPVGNDGVARCDVVGRTAEPREKKANVLAAIPESGAESMPA